MSLDKELFMGMNVSGHLQSTEICEYSEFDKIRDSEC